MCKVKISIQHIEKIKAEAEERVDKELKRLFAGKIENIKDINDKEIRKLLIEIHKIEGELRKQEVKNHPKLKKTDFLIKIFLMR